MWDKVPQYTDRLTLGKSHEDIRQIAVMNKNRLLEGLPSWSLVAFCGIKSLE